MICPICEKQMELKEVLTIRTTSPDDDDTWEIMWTCECGHTEPNIDDREEDEQ